MCLLQITSQSLWASLVFTFKLSTFIILSIAWFRHNFTFCKIPFLLPKAFLPGLLEKSVSYPHKPFWTGEMHFRWASSTGSYKYTLLCVWIFSSFRWLFIFWRQMWVLYFFFFFFYIKHHYSLFSVYLLL